MRPDFEPRPKLGAIVASRLRDLILSGEFEAGQRMSPDELASLLKVSAMPIREALQTLATEGLLDVLPRRGYRVALITSRDIGDIYSVFAFISGKLAEHAASSIDAEGIEHLHKIMIEFEGLDRLRLSKIELARRAQELDYQFHRTINNVPQAACLRRFLLSAHRLIPREILEVYPEWHEASRAEHPHIVAALEAHDGPRAAQLIIDHHTKGANRLIGHIVARPKAKAAA